MPGPRDAPPSTPTERCTDPARAEQPKMSCRRLSAHDYEAKFNSHPRPRTTSPVRPPHAHHPIPRHRARHAVRNTVGDTVGRVRHRKRTTGTTRLADSTLIVVKAVLLGCGFEQLLARRNHRDRAHAAPVGSACRSRPGSPPGRAAGDRHGALEELRGAIRYLAPDPRHLAGSARAGRAVSGMKPSPVCEFPSGSSRE
jgi:hypothetical protein